MTNEEAKAFLDNLKICIDEHPIVADWLVEIADRKTEPSNSEKPNNCDTCRNKGFEGCEQPCLGCGCCGLYEPKDEPTISKMEQVDKDINVRSKDEPTTQTETQNSNLTFEKDECAKEYEELGLKELKELIEADRKTEPTSSKMEQVDKDEPQKKEVEWVYNKRERLWYPYSNGELLFKDEPQTERSE